MSDRSWWSNAQGAADWATGNRWDFDNMGGMSSGTVTGSPSSFSGAVSPEWTKPSGGNWFHPDNAGLRAGAISDAFSPRSNTSLIQPFSPAASNWGKYEMYHPPQKQGGGLMGTIGRIGGFIAGNMIAPGVGGGPGAAIGGSIGDSIG